MLITSLLYTATVSATHSSDRLPSLRLVCFRLRTRTKQQTLLYYTAPPQTVPLGPWSPSAPHGRTTTRICPSACRAALCSVLRCSLVYSILGICLQRHPVLHRCSLNCGLPNPVHLPARYPVRRLRRRRRRQSLVRLSEPLPDARLSWLRDKGLFRRRRCCPRVCPPLLLYHHPIHRPQGSFVACQCCHHDKHRRCIQPGRCDVSFPREPAPLYHATPEQMSSVSAQKC